MLRSESFKTVSIIKCQWQSVLNYVLFFSIFYIFLSSAEFGFACGFGLYSAMVYFNKKPYKVFICLAAASLCIEQSLYVL